MSFEPTDGEALEQPAVDAISGEALTILLVGLEDKFRHAATHVPPREYRTIMLELQDAAHALNVAYKLAEALLEGNASLN